MKKIIRFDKFLLARLKQEHVGHVHVIGDAFWEVAKALQSVSFDKKGNVIRAETESAVYVYVGEER